MADDEQVLHIAFVWHMHQPYYRNLKDKYFRMPWVRLHGIKDYYDMVAVLDEFPDLKQTFNLVPSLIEQIEEYTAGGGSDNHLELSRRLAAELTANEKSEILETFFSAHHPTMIQPFPRYRRLLAKAAKNSEAFSVQDFLDLQVWSNLVWFDPIFRKDDMIQKLIVQGEGFTEDDKNRLLDKQIDILKSIVPKYREVQDRGQIEISVTPFYHPIMPLLYNTDIARESDPRVKLPARKFNHPEDVEYQVASAVKFYEKRFGRKPEGMWPSEGSVSPDILRSIINNGIKWIASDEEVLARSMGISPNRNDAVNVSSHGVLYQPYTIQADGQNLSIIFRDHVLSDRLGFVYSNWNPKNAAEDFIDKLIGIKLHLEKIKAPGRFVPIILDGENAWEYYVNDGYDFFRELYGRLSGHPELKTVTVSEFLNNHPRNRGELKKLFPGSWINHNFNIWIGHEEDNLAWDLLSETRDMLTRFQNAEEAKTLDPRVLETAWKEIYIAEGSDWCWWFGDEHQDPDNDRFDSLFRSNLIYIYELLGKEIPDTLLRPIRSNFLGSNLTVPTDYIEPVIDGKLSNFYEWYSAGYFDCTKAGSTMHRAVRHTKGIFFGFDRENLYLRIDPDPTLDLGTFIDTDFKIEFFKPAKVNVFFNQHRGTFELENIGKMKKYPQAEIEKFLEMKIPMDIFPVDDVSQFDFRITVSHAGKQLEIWPPVEVISIKLPTAAPESIFW